MINKIKANVFFLVIVYTLAACIFGVVSAQNYSDVVLKEQVETVLQSASDLPANTLTVEAMDGVVTIMGSVVCDMCGGSRTPPGVRTIQQSLGAVVRAIPGVKRIEFDLNFQ